MGVLLYEGVCVNKVWHEAVRVPARGEGGGDGWEGDVRVASRGFFKRLERAGALVHPARSEGKWEEWGGGGGGGEGGRARS